MRDLRPTLAAVLALVTLGLVPAPAHADESSTVTNAVLRWGMSNEANNAAHAPGTMNFFSAGKIPDPGQGGTQLPQSSWKQSDGAVAIEKWDGSAYRPATWAGLRTDAAGTAITSATSGRYSGHQLVFSGGAGVLDRDAGTARIAWTGSASVIFYSGMTFFYLADPVLEVADGKATLTATASGFGTSQANPDTWSPIDPETVTLANLSGVSVAGAGFNSTPAYDGVKVTSGGQTYTNSFPQSFISFLDEVGSAGFWYATGGSTDAAKKALPLTVSYDAADPVRPVGPGDPDPVDPIDNDAPEAPTTITRTTNRTVTVPAPAVAPPAAVAPVSAAPVATTNPVQLLSAPAAVADRDVSSSPAGWWLGGAFLALAALVVLGALIYPSRSPRPVAEDEPPRKEHP